MGKRPCEVKKVCPNCPPATHTPLICYLCVSPQVWSVPKGLWITCLFLFCALSQQLRIRVRSFYLGPESPDDNASDYIALWVAVCFSVHENGLGHRSSAKHLLFRWQFCQRQELWAATLRTRPFGLVSFCEDDWFFYFSESSYWSRARWERFVLIFV